MKTQDMSAFGPFDLLISGGLVLDGTGGDPVRADIGIIDDRIAAVGDLTATEAARVIDASGRHVAPGFIDIHTHSDVSVTFDPGQASAIGMGVTSQIVGNCGLAIGFANSSDVFAFEKRWLAPHGGRITWDSFGEYLNRVETGGTATNYVPLAGQGTLRKRVMGMTERRPDAGEMTEMQHELDAAFEAGAWGLSSGLEYPPSAYADTAELIELCRVAARYGGLYATHLRNEGDTLVEAVQEALDVAEGAGLPLQLSHHKAEGRHNWGKVVTTLEMVTQARERGLDVQLDQYPYTAFMTGLSIQILPLSALSGSNEELAARLTDEAYRKTLAAEIRALHPEWDDLSDTSPWFNIQIGVCRSKPEAQGRTLAALAREAGTDPIDYVLNLLAESEGFVSAINFAIGETDIARVLRYPYTMIGSDGVATHPTGTGGVDRIHPRTYGTFPRVLAHYVRDQHVLTEAEAIHKMTGLPAARLGWTDRGLIREGAYADIVVYNPQTVGDVATFTDPHRFAVGIDTVIVNGRIAQDHGAATGVCAGRVLRKTSHAASPQSLR